MKSYRLLQLFSSRVVDPESGYGGKNKKKMKEKYTF
jgi:hypothetical protein